MKNMQKTTKEVESQYGNDEWKNVLEYPVRLIEYQIP